MIRLEPTDRDALRIPEGATLAHIGFPKTGSSALQWAASRRRRMEANGLFYPGDARFQFRQFLALVKAYPESGEAGPKPDHWARMVKEISRSKLPRTFISSEAGSQASPAAIERLAKDLGPDTRVVVTLRGLAERLVAAWQQRVREGSETWDFDEWMHIMLGDRPAGTMNPVFIERNLDPIGIVQRWARVLGEDHVTVVLVDKRTPDLLYDAFESMLDLPSGQLIKGVPKGLTRLNRGMNQTEIEFVRQIRLVFQQAGIGRARLEPVLSKGGIARARVERVPGPDEEPLRMADWAYERIVPIATAQREKLEQSGLHVVGDPAVLENPVQTRSTPYPAIESIPLDLAVQLVVGTAARGIGVHQGLRQELGGGELVRSSNHDDDENGPDDDD